MTTPPETESPEPVSGSTFIWSIMAVTGLWLAALFVIAIGYTLFECIGPCTDPAPAGVWWATLGIGAILFVLSGRIGARLTRMPWMWACAVPGLLFVLWLAI